MKKKEMAKTYQYIRVNVNEMKESDLLRNINLTGLSLRGYFLFIWVALFRQLWNQY